MKYTLRLALLLFFSVPACFVNAQNSAAMQKALDDQSVTRRAYFAEQKEKVLEYAKKNNKPVSYRDGQGNLVVMVAISETGVPIYKTTDNAGAAVTTGVTKLREGGGLGLNLEGDGMVVGIWDGGIVDDHLEYNDRILSREGAAEDNHASHVTGTILAKGTNAAAKGMAPKAKAFTFDFNNDEPEMLTLAKPDQTSILLSNHSYGLITGWRFDAGSWQWFGDASVSSQEDYKFGYYSSNARFWDNIAFNAPYYLMVKSAGNDRTDTGPTNRVNPSDCNGGSGFDCLGDNANSKNILVVGAVSKIANYTDASSVLMSTFSSWGPTDDGRIKPDLVGAGVNLFSTIASPTNDQYGSLSGTSMATPNVTGSLILLQELYKNLHGGNFMRSATLKALAIHTTKEAGINPGPDYAFGWGVLDDEAAAKLLLAEDDQNIYVEEQSISQGQKYELVITPKANQKITATLVWTDPAGTVVPAALDPTNIMLVNDLDLRIIDDAGNEQKPWILNPSNPGLAATTGDNIRDNVEKIEFENPEPRNYKVVVRHKNTLQGGSQNFSLIISYTSVNDPRVAYYWIGRDGAWNSPTNWSLTSGGVSANKVPGINDRVFVDENSFNAANQTIDITPGAACSSFTWLTKDRAGISLQSNSLNVDGNFVLSSPNFFISSQGEIHFTGGASPENSVNLSTGDFLKASLEFDGQSTWTLTGNATIGELYLTSGNVIAKNLDIALTILQSNGAAERSLDLSDTKIRALAGSVIQPGLELVSNGTTIHTSDTSGTGLNWNEVSFDGEIITGIGAVTLLGSGSTYESIVIPTPIFFSVANNNKINNFDVAGHTQFVVYPGVTLELTESTVLHSEQSKPISFRTLDETGFANLLFDGHFKLCFDYIIAEHVSITGSAVINAGTHSDIIDSENWSEFPCEDVLFPDFTLGFTCEHSLTQFTDQTSGTVTEWSWNFGDLASGSNTSADQHPYHVFSGKGTFTVTLVAKNGDEERSYSRDVTITDNDLPANTVVINNSSLFSVKSANSYQWYKNGEAVEGGNARSFTFDGEPGSYFVVIANANCNIASAPVIILAGEEEATAGPGAVVISPNPARDQFTISLPVEQLPAVAEVVTILGKPLSRLNLDRPQTVVDMKNNPVGTYVVKIASGKKVYIKKIIITK